MYLPKEILETVGLEEGDLVVVRVEGERIVVEKAPDVFLLAARRKKLASTGIEEFKEKSEAEQEEREA